MRRFFDLQAAVKAASVFSQSRNEYTGASYRVEVVLDRLRTNDVIVQSLPADGVAAWTSDVVITPRVLILSKRRQDRKDGHTEFIMGSY
jgi:hypothetical protein